MRCLPPGLSLIFGVMRLVNIAHGDLIVLAAYVAMMVVQATGLHPLARLIIVVPIMAAFGYALQRGILNRTLGKDLLPPLLVTFGLSVILQNGLLEIFTADSRKLNAGALETASFSPADGISIGYPAAADVRDRRRRDCRRCNSCSTAPPLAAPSARLPTMPKSPQLMGLDRRQVYACGDGAVPGRGRALPASSWPSARISIPSWGRRG